MFVSLFDNYLCILFDKYLPHLLANIFAFFTVIFAFLTITFVFDNYICFFDKYMSPFLSNIFVVWQFYLPPQDLRSSAIISSISTEQSSKAPLHQFRNLCSFFQQMQTAFKTSSLSDIFEPLMPTQFNTNMEEATAATLAKIWCFANWDIDRVSTSRHILGKEVLFEEAPTRWT